MTPRPCRALLLSLLLALPSCALLETRTANDLFVLRAESPPPGTPMALDMSVAQPVLAPGLDTARIAVLKSPQNISYYDGVAWAQPLGGMLQSFLVDALAQARLMHSVSSDRQGVASDLMLNVDVEEFEADITHTPARVRIRLTASLVDANSHGVIAAFPITQTLPVNVTGPEGLVAAFNRGMNMAAREIARDIAMACDQGEDECGR